MSETAKAFNGLFNLLGGLSGLLSITLIIWQGGQLYQRVQDHGRRLDDIQQQGSIGLREHVKADDERVSDLKLRTTEMAVRLGRQEDATIKLMEVMGDIKAINAKLDNLKEQIRIKP